MGRSSIDKLDEHIGARLRMLRSSLELTLEQVGSTLNVTPQQVSRFEHGKQKLSAAQLFRLAQFMGCSVGWFYLGFEPDRDSYPTLRQRVSRNLTADQAERLSALQKAWLELNSEKKRDAVVALVEAMAG